MPIQIQQFCLNCQFRRNISLMIINPDRRILRKAQIFNSDPVPIIDRRCEHRSKNSLQGSLIVNSGPISLYRIQVINSGHEAQTIINPKLPIPTHHLVISLSTHIPILHRANCPIRSSLHYEPVKYDNQPRRAERRATKPH